MDAAKFKKRITVSKNWASFKKQSKKKKIVISVQDELDKEDAMLMTVGSFLELQNSFHQQKCRNCGERISRITLERQGSQYRMSCICESCYSKTAWVNSEDWQKPGIIRKFAESMTVSGIDFWQYKRYCMICSLLSEYIFCYSYYFT